MPWHSMALALEWTDQLTQSSLLGRQSGPDYLDSKTGVIELVGLRLGAKPGGEGGVWL